MLYKNAVLKVCRQIRYLLDGAVDVAVHTEANDAATNVAQRLRLRPIANVTCEIHVELETKMVDLVIVEVVTGKDEGRHEVRVSESRSTAAAWQEAENVAHDVGQSRRAVGGAGEHCGTVGGKVKTGTVLGTWVTTILPLSTPVLHNRNIT